MWGSRVIVPPQGRNFIIEELHDTHPGISRMKSLARSYVWWPKIDRDLETKDKQCRSCQSTQKAPAVAPLHPWEFPSKPWSRQHIDYAGPFMGDYMFLIVVDAYSKWMEVYPMRTATSQATIENFAVHLLPMGSQTLLCQIMVHASLVQHLQSLCSAMASNMSDQHHFTQRQTVWLKEQCRRSRNP